MALLGYLPKLKRSLGLDFEANFCMTFPLKWSLFNTLSIENISISYPFFPSQDIEQNVLLSSHLDKLFIYLRQFNFKIYLRSSSKAIADSEKRGRPKYKN